MSGILRKAQDKVKRLSNELQRRSRSNAPVGPSHSEPPRSVPQASEWTKVTSASELGPLKSAADEFKTKVDTVLNDAKNARNQEIAKSGGNKYYLWYRTIAKEIEVVLANRKPPSDYTTAGEDVLGSVFFKADNVTDADTWKRLERYAEPDSNEGWEGVFK